MISFLLTLLLLQPQLQSQTLNPYPLLPLSLQSSFEGWLQFTVNLITSKGQQAIIIFGGTINETCQNLAVLTQPTNQDATIVIQNTFSPQPRYSHCTLAEGDSLYVYGGIGQMGNILNDLWQFNTTTLAWKLISNYSLNISKCNLIKNASFLLVLGLDSTNKLLIYQYSLTTGNWLSISYSYGYAVISEGMTWQQTLEKTQTNLADLSPRQAINNSNLVYSNELTFNNFCMCSLDNSIYYLVTDRKILLLNLLTRTINWVINIYPQHDQFQCQITPQWLFIIAKNNQFLILCYHSLSDFYKSSVKIYKNFNTQFNLISFLINQDIYFISEFQLDGWILQKDCNQTVKNNSNVLACFYGDVFCQMKFRGETCQEEKCPNTLSLIDLSTFSQILYQCNNHGVCVDAQCICNEYWTGPDCSTYTRKVCYGQLLDNWPIMNCECLSQTAGGNNCQVTFCFNDCNNQGTCLPNGQCQCNKNYYAADCSVSIIELDQPVSNP